MSLWSRSGRGRIWWTKVSDLPTRESFKRAGITLDDVKPILRAYVLGQLVEIGGDGR